MWHMRRNLDTTPMPRGRSTIQFIYGGLPEARRNWWLIVEPAKEVDLCAVDPGHDVDLYVTTDPIGKASCRERVCQYVEISVVAVSLKKKNIYNKTNTKKPRK